MMLQLQTLLILSCSTATTATLTDTHIASKAAAGAVDAEAGPAHTDTAWVLHCTGQAIVGAMRDRDTPLTGESLINHHYICVSYALPLTIQHTHAQ
jgi:hypothetical protein